MMMMMMTRCLLGHSIFPYGMENIDDDNDSNDNDDEVLT